VPRDKEGTSDTRRLGLALKRLAIVSPLEFKVMTAYQNLQSSADFWWVRVKESLKNLQLERVKIRAYDYVQRVRRWLQP
jgi:hypothetical protein